MNRDLTSKMVDTLIVAIQWFLTRMGPKRRNTDWDPENPGFYLGLDKAPVVGNFCFRLDIPALD